MLSKLSTHLGPGSLFSGDEPLILEFSSSTWMSTNVGTFSLVDAWNEFFGTIETPFEDVNVEGNKISLIGGENLKLKPNCFISSDIVSIKDNSRVITVLGTFSFDGCTLLTDVSLKGVTYSYAGCFKDNSSLTTISLTNLKEISGSGYFFYNCGSVSNFNLPSLTAISGGSNFYNCNSMTNLSLPICTTLGDTVYDNGNFNATGQTIDITVTPELMTCNSGTPDGDILLLLSNNTVTVHIPTGITSFSPTSATFSGSTVSVVGKGFYLIDSVKIGGVEVATYSLDSFTNLSLVTGSVSSGDVSVSGTYGSASKSGFEWDATAKFSYIASTQSVNIIPPTAKVLILGDSESGVIANYISNKGYDIQTSYRLLSLSEDGTDLNTSNYDVVIYYTNGNPVIGSTNLSTNLNSFVNSGGHLITGTFLWNSAPSGFDFTLTPFTYSNVQYYSSDGLLTNVISHPLNLNGTFSLAGANYTNGNVSLISGATAVSLYTNSVSGESNVPAIAYLSRGSSKLIGFNTYLGTSFTEIKEFLVNAILWATGNSPSFSESSWTDLSTYNKNLTLKHGVSLDTPYSVLFDGTNIGYGTSSQMTVKYTNGFTIETWVNFSSLTSANYIMQFVDQDFIDTNPDLILVTIDNDLQIQSSNSVNFSTTLTTGRFIKAVVTYDSSNGETKTYINGQLTNTGTLNLSSSYKKTIGKLRVGNSGSTQPMRVGMLNFVNYIQDATTILNNYNNERTTYDEAKGSFLFNSSSSQYLSSSSSDYIIGTNSFTLEAFVKTATQSDYDGIISMLDNISPFNGVSININNGYFDFYSKGGQYTSYTASNDTWNHVAIARDSGTISYFANGRLIAEYSDSYNYTIQDLVIGRYYTDLDSHYIDGAIAQPRLTIGSALYSGTFSVTPPLTSSSNTKLLLLNAYNKQLLDSSGLTHSITSHNNVGWTSSLPSTIPMGEYDIYFDASNASSYSGSGTTLNSIGASGSITGLIGTMTSVSYNSGVAGGVLDFSGSSYISFGQYDFGDTITVNAWVYPRNRYSINTLMSNATAGGSANGFKLEWNSWTTTDHKMLIENGNGSSGNVLYTNSGVITENSWQMLTYVIDFVNQTGKLYLNGVEQSSVSGGIVSNISRNSSWYIGCMVGISYQMNAYLGEFKVWKSLKSDSSITSEFNSSKSRYGL